MTGGALNGDNSSFFAAGFGRLFIGGAGAAAGGVAASHTGPDGSSTVIAGTGTSDLGLPPQYGLGTDLNITPLGLAITRNGNLVFSSGHTVYHLHDPAHAGTSSTP